MALLLLLFSCSLVYNGTAYLLHSTNTFQRHASTATSLNLKRRASAKSHLKMDLEETSSSRRVDKKLLSRFEVPLVRHGRQGQTANRQKLSVPRSYHHDSVQEAATRHRMPWKTSIDATYSDDLFYMPFWEWQLSFMKESLTNLRGIPVTSSKGQDMSYVENPHKKMRLHTALFTCDEYKTIRMTVMDAGKRTQVFTSLWYPNPAFNLPVLGTDLLQFNQKKHLCVVDYQPIQSSEDEHDQAYEHLLQPIRSQYPSLQGKMTQRFYDENRFFSNQMLLGRHENLHGARDMVYQDLFPAWKQYVQTHVDLVQSTQPNVSQIPHVLERHAAYDDYSAARDPAHCLLANCFGQDWADDYVYDILFPFSKRTETG